MVDCVISRKKKPAMMIIKWKTTDSQRHWSYGEISHITETEDRGRLAVLPPTFKHDDVNQKVVDSIVLYAPVPTPNEFKGVWAYQIWVHGVLHESRHGGAEYYEIEETISKEEN